MSGDKDYVTTKLEDFTTRVDNLELKIGLKHLVHNPEAEQLLSLSENELDKMTAGECANAKYILLQFALSIQKTINRATAIKNWANRNIDVIVSKKYFDYNEFLRIEYRRQCVINDDSYAAKLAEISNEHQAVIDSLSYIAQAANNLSSSFQTLFMAKNRTEGNYE